MIDESANLICQTSTEIALKLLQRTFELRGPEGLGAKPRPELIGLLFTHLPDTLQDAVRMGFLHSSRARGRIPGSLRAAADVRYLGHSAGTEDATLLHFEVPSFGSVAAELFEAVERDYRKLARLRPGEPPVYARILGSIPAEESDEEFAAAVEDLT